MIFPKTKAPKRVLKFQIVLKVRILMLLSPTSTQYLVGAPITLALR